TEARFNARLPAWLIELHGVVKKVDQRLLEPNGVTRDQGIAHRSPRETHATNPRFGFDREQRGIDCLFDGDWPWLSVAAAGLEVRKREQIGCNVVQTDGVRQDDLDKPPVVFGIGKRA